MKRKFVKVMFFGALAFAVSTAVTSCKDCEDDVKGLQEQIDKITSITHVSTTDMKAAVDAAKAELQAKVDRLEGLLNDKAAQTTLESEIKRLEEALKTAVGESAADFATKLATAKNDLTTLINAKADKSYVDGLKAQIDQLNAMKTTLAALTAAEEKFKLNGDVSGYEATGFGKYVNESIKNALEGYATTAYVGNAVKDGLLEQMNTINKSVSAKTGSAIASLDEFVGKVYAEIYDKNNGILARLDKLKEYSDAIDAFVATENDGYAKYADVLAQIEKNRFALTSVIGADGDQFNSNVAKIVKEVLADNDGALKKLETELKKEIDALKGRIQSVAYVPTNSARTVDFTALYAKKLQADADYSTVALTGASTCEVKFRISPAAAAAAFVDNYNVSFSADQVIARSATDRFVAVGEPVVADGFVTYTIQSNADKSFAVCMHVTAKPAKEATVGNANITSDYFAAIVGKKYVVGAEYKIATELDQDIAYDVTGAKADYANEGEIWLKVSSAPSGTAGLASVKLSTYPGFNTSSLKTTFTLSNATSFKLDASGTAVVLKEYGLPSYIGSTTTVNAKVEATGFFIPVNSNKLGVVTVTRTTKKATVDYGTIKQTWNNSMATIAATKFPLSTIYNNANVSMTLAEFQGMTGTSTSIGAKVGFVIATGNVLTATVAAQTPAGSYPIAAKFISDGREITVTATVVVENPAIPALKVDVQWGGTPEAGTVSITPTLNNGADNKPSSITVAYKLSTLFSNYNDLLNTISAIPGAALDINVPGVAKIVGVSYNPSTTMLTFDKDTYTGKTIDGKDAKVQVVTTVKLAGTATPLQTLTADASIDNISGSWVAGPTAVTLNSKSETYALSKGFSWNDVKGKAMWKDGTAIIGGTDFSSGVRAFDIYGLTAPIFHFVDAEGKMITDKYLSIDPISGALTFTAGGKGFGFESSYTARIMVVAHSQWGTISGYAGNNIITVTVPKGVK